VPRVRAAGDRLRASRLPLAVLALALGILAMHSLAGGDHRAHTAAPVPISDTAHDPAAHQAAAAGPRGVAVYSADCLGPCAPDGGTIATTCLAVLAGLAGLLVVRPLRGTAADVVRTSWVLLPRTVATWHPPPSLKLLCISRT
jgi:hypothetical protein